MRVTLLKFLFALFVEFINFRRSSENLTNKPSSSMSTSSLALDPRSNEFQNISLSNAVEKVISRGREKSAKAKRKLDARTTQEREGALKLAKTMFAICSEDMIVVS